MDGGRANAYVVRPDGDSEVARQNELPHDPERLTIEREIRMMLLGYGNEDSDRRRG
jgi:hypothetical protein